MRVAIMQPYYLPYPGYFQLMNAVDLFIIYDKVKFTKKGWINRNRILFQGNPKTVSIPVAKNSDFSSIQERKIAPNYNPQKLLNIFRECYKNSLFWDRNAKFLENIHFYKAENLFEFLYNSISLLHENLQSSSKLLISSQIEPNNTFHGVDRVLNLCKLVGAKEYINPIGGIDLYDPELFSAHKIKLKFLKSEFGVYTQFNENHVKDLSIIDSLMFLDLKNVIDRINNNFTFLST